jgi:radical SAM superfamily enzyme YgiQ (UPF0313 family)
MSRRRVLLIQLPIPPVGPTPVHGNVPLAAGYLKMYAELKGLGERHTIDILPTHEANTFGDAALVEAILARSPWMVGFTCYLWNIDRTLWILEQLKARRPELITLVGGPEITGDNDWTIRHPAVDYAAIGEGEQTFVELLNAIQDDGKLSRIAAPFGIPGLHERGQTARPLFRKPLPNLNEISSPYLAGILDAADEKMLLLETIRGCVYKCKFCYYPKSYDALYYVDEEKIRANLRHARERNVREVVLLDPTLNQGRNFDKFVELLAEENPDRQFTYFGELRAEGIKESTAKLLKQANFTEVEIGLQSIDPLAMDLMDRKNNMKAFERGVKSLLDVGIDVKVDLIIGLPGDTPDSVRRGLDYLHTNRFFSRIQVFNLAILPGTAFRMEAEQLGLQYQSRTPYYVMKTPTLDLGEMYELMTEAQEMFDIEFDPWDDPVLKFSAEETWSDGEATSPNPTLAASRIVRCRRVDLDSQSPASPTTVAPPATQMAQAFTIWLRGGDFARARRRACEIVAESVRANPHGTFQIILEPTANHARLTPAILDDLLRAALESTSYLDRFYAVMPGRPKGAKRLIVVLPQELRDELGRDWADALGELATLVWQGDVPDAMLPTLELDAYELLVPTI